MLRVLPALVEFNLGMRGYDVVWGSIFGLAHDVLVQGIPICARFIHERLDLTSSFVSRLVDDAILG